MRIAPITPLMTFQRSSRNCVASYQRSGVTIFDFLNHGTGRLDPSYSAVQRRTRLCRQTVAKALARLKQLGIINRIARPCPLSSNRHAPRGRKEPARRQSSRCLTPIRAIALHRRLQALAAPLASETGFYWSLRNRKKPPTDLYFIYRPKRKGRLSGMAANAAITMSPRSPARAGSIDGTEPKEST
jgi:hypothetical protein